MVSGFQRSCPARKIAQHHVGFGEPYINRNRQPIACSNMQKRWLSPTSSLARCAFVNDALRQLIPEQVC